MRALWKLAWVEVKLFLREPLTVVFAFAFPLIVLFVLAEVFGTEVRQDDHEVVFRGVAPTDYYVPAYVALVVASIGLVSLPVHLAGYRERGVLRRLRASGVSASTLLATQVLVTLLLSVVSGLLLGAAAGAAYGIRAPSAPAGLLGAFVLATLAFAAIGVLLGALLPTARAAQGAGLLLFFVMMFISGAGPPPEVLSGSLRVISKVLPLTHAIRAIQDPWLGFPASATALLATAGFLVAAALLAVRFFRWE